MNSGLLASIAKRAAAALEHGAQALPLPTNLQRAESDLQKRYGSLGRAIPQRDRTREAVERLRRRGVLGLQPRDHYVLSFSLSSPVEELNGDCLLERKPIVEPLLSEWRAQAAERRLRAARWRGLLYSYLQFRGSRDSGRSAWHTLRSLIKFAEPFRGGDHEAPAWMEGYRRHAQLTDDQPCQSYVRGLVRDDWEQVNALRTDLSVPEHSWVWTELIDAFVDHAVRERDDAFRRHLSTALKIVGLAQSHVDGALARLLDRYAACSAPERHEELLQLALHHWKSPQLSSRSSWTLVRPETKQLVAGWLALEDLRDFFELCQGSAHGDTERLEFWLGYIHSASYTRILLGQAMASSYNPDIVAFRKRKGERCGKLSGQGAANNAFMMVLKDTLVVEFSEKGNAAYFYRTAKVPFQQYKPMLSLIELKNREAGDAVTHQPTDGRWKTKFEYELAVRGLHRQVLQSTTAARQGSPSAGHWGRQSAVELPEALLKYLGQRRLSVVDLRNRGGALWIHTGVKLWDIHEQLTKLGWSFKDGKGYWTE